MPRHLDGRTLAGRTGWDVVLQYPAVGQEGGRGSVMLCTHPKLPGWVVGHKGRGWALARAESGMIVRFAALWQAIETGNRMIADGGMGEVAP